MKPILFNTEMVCAILDNRKTVTRRVVRGINNSADFLTLIDNPSVIAVDKHGQEYPKDVKGLYANFVHDGDPEYPLVKAPYRPGDILYVRETWGLYHQEPGFYVYKADKHEGLEFDGFKWRPSIHMPREAARIFLRVTDVRVERLWDITEEQARVEGLYKGWASTVISSMATTAKQAFMWVWDSTIKPADRVSYSCDANPWVWVIEFERISREEAE